MLWIQWRLNFIFNISTALSYTSFSFCCKFPAKHGLHAFCQLSRTHANIITRVTNLARARVRRSRSVVSHRLEGTRISTGWILRTLASSSERDALSLKQSTITSPMLGCTTWDTEKHRNRDIHNHGHSLNRSKPSRWGDFFALIKT